jgi:hypothetical protein
LFKMSAVKLVAFLVDPLTGRLVEEGN